MDAPLFARLCLSVTDPEDNRLLDQLPGWYGDYTTLAVGEAEPLTLAYGRGEVFGEHCKVWTENVGGSECQTATMP